MADKPINNKEYLKERIKFLTEFFKQLFTLFFLVASGFTTLMVKVFGNPNYIEGAFLIVGICIIIPILRKLFSLYREIENLLNELNEKDQ
jgi:hypothetical protein